MYGMAPSNWVDNLDDGERAAFDLAAMEAGVKWKREQGERASELAKARGRINKAMGRGD